MDLEEDEIGASEQCLVDENEGKLFDFMIQLLVFVVITIQLSSVQRFTCQVFTWVFASLHLDKCWCPIS